MLPIEFRTVHEMASRVMALMKGDIHGCDGYLPADQVEKLEKDPNVNVYEEQSMRIFLIRMHNQRPPFNDVHVRRAISYAFDYDAFNKEILKGRVARNFGPIPNNMWGAPKDLKGYTFNLKKAKEELGKGDVLPATTSIRDRDCRLVAHPDFQADLTTQRFL